jgi:hypothetical protein
LCEQHDLTCNVVCHDGTVVQWPAKTELTGNHKWHAWGRGSIRSYVNQCMLATTYLAMHHT